MKDIKFKEMIYMIKRFINFIKMDYSSVKFSIKWLSNDRIPTWMIVIYYSILAPIGLLLYFPLKWLIERHTKKMLNNIEKD